MPDADGTQRGKPVARSDIVYPHPSPRSAPVLPRAADPTYYAARELDVFPRPVAPLDLDQPGLRVAATGSERIRVFLLIDEGGTVVEVTAVEAGLPDGAWETLRAALAATRFVPGEKEGRAVKSRVLLSVSFDPARAERAGR